MKNRIVSDFVNAINEADPEKIVSLLTDDHIFIDSQDNRVTGKDNLRLAWTGYFGLIKDYRIEINETIENKSAVYMTGYACGNCIKSDNEGPFVPWRIPAAWRAEIRDNKIRSWQIYADNSVVIEILNRIK
jgi:ketosteroid isomerase-like protein